MEIATFESVTWWNEARLHQGLGYRTQAEIESEFVGKQPASGNITNQGKCLGTKLVQP